MIYHCPTHLRLLNHCGISLNGFRGPTGLAIPLTFKSSDRTLVPKQPHPNPNERRWKATESAELVDPLPRHSQHLPHFGRTDKYRQSRSIRPTLVLFEHQRLDRDRGLYRNSDTSQIASRCGLGRIGCRSRDMHREEHIAFAVSTRRTTDRFDIYLNIIEANQMHVGEHVRHSPVTHLQSPSF